MLKISFDFNEETQKISNLKVLKETEKKLDNDLPIVKVEDNRLLLTKKAIELLEATYGDRINVNYVQVNNETTFPVIGKAFVFSDPDAGNKLSKTDSISFRGIQRTILTKYGQMFKIEEYKPGMFKMISIDEEDLSQGDSDLKTEINNLQTI